MRARWRGLPILVLGVAVAALTVACGDDEETPTEADPASGGVAAAAEGPGEAPEQPPAEGGGTAGEPQGEAAAEIADPSFLLRASAAGPYRSGELGRFAISLTARGGYHVNQEYPISVELTAPSGVDFPKARLERGDAAAFGEEEARFDVPFTPGAAGDHRVEAKVSFAVCTPENCVPDERTLAVLLPVE